MPHATSCSQTWVYPPGDSSKKNRTCQDLHCDKGVARGPHSERYSPYWCKDHACHVGPARCNNRKSRREDYCSQHATCTAPGCEARPKSLSLKPLPWYCIDHTCRHYNRLNQTGCSKGVTLGSDYCEGHRHQYWARTAATTSSVCRTPQCPYQPADNSWYCLYHKCLNCENQAEDLEQRLCFHHQIPSCPVIDCTLRRDVTATNNLDGFCAIHRRCREYERGCDGITTQEDLYCDAHRCSMSGCNSKRDLVLDPQNPYCETHTCIEDGCINVRVNNGDLYRRCRYHTCHRIGCHIKAVFAGGFCLDHNCDIQGCQEEKLGDASYCNDHVCKEGGCHAVAKAPGGYCQARHHACAAPECAARRGDADYPKLCEHHGRKKLHRDGIRAGREALKSELRSPPTSYFESNSSNIRMSPSLSSRTYDEASHMGTHEILESVRRSSKERAMYDDLRRKQDEFTRETREDFKRNKAPRMSSARPNMGDPIPGVRHVPVRPYGSSGY
ncbi:hypothetical protein G7046_g110 [Stylonectria norvegica]|nr:hypothetical protein G7046_g110 [Stylonectria norvegica]